ncbi:MAG: energy transducer TonB [Bacteroidetes bacterium]|jgi:protein TonB|nr:energy transducer TonB [Bacteroidota bacterium]PTM20308.1 MAG: energy transducer TonB [Bacteroidota bacterium]
MIQRKNPEADLRKYYIVLLQIGMLIALTISITVVRVDFRSEGPAEIVMDEQEIVEMEEIIQTRQIETPPPPPRPPVPVEVPNDEIIEDVDINISADLDIGDQLSMPPPPEEEPEEDFFIVVENQPELIGGIGGLQKKIRYPEMARRAGIEGRVYVQFIVNERGEVENPVIIRGIGGGADEEALRVVREAKFRPGLQRGRPVRVQFSLPIVFKLQN